MDPNDFDLSGKTDRLVYRDTQGRFGFLLTIESGFQEPTPDDFAEAKAKAVLNFPVLLERAPKFVELAYRQIAEASGAGATETLDEFCEQFSLEEVSLVDGEAGHLYYKGANNYAGVRLTIYCDDLEFAEAELEST